MRPPDTSTTLCLVLHIQNPQTTLHRPATKIFLHQHRSFGSTNYLQRQTFHHEILMLQQPRTPAGTHSFSSQRAALLLSDSSSSLAHLHVPTDHSWTLNTARTREARRFAEVINPHGCVNVLWQPSSREVSYPLQVATSKQGASKVNVWMGKQEQNSFVLVKEQQKQAARWSPRVGRSQQIQHFPGRLLPSLKEAVRNWKSHWVILSASRKWSSW